MARRHGMGGFAVVLGVLGGCVYSPATLTKTGAPRTPREPNCHFTMLTLPPNGGYFEVGTVDIYRARYTEISEFKKAIQPSVCEAGGDAAIAFVNGTGAYIKATVIRRTSFKPGGGQRASTERKAKAHRPEKTAAVPSGCQYDTQCKGERVCVKGECVALPGATGATTSTPPTQ